MQTTLTDRFVALTADLTATHHPAARIARQATGICKAAKLGKATAAHADTLETLWKQTYALVKTSTLSGFRRLCDRLGKLIATLGRRLRALFPKQGPRPTTPAAAKAAVAQTVAPTSTSNVNEQLYTRACETAATTADLRAARCDGAW